MDLDTIRDLLSGLRSESWEERERASKKVAEVSNPEARPLLLEALVDPDMAVREAVAEALGNLPSPDTERGLLTLLADREWEVRWAALRSLGALWGDDEVKALGSPDERHRTEAARALGERYQERLHEPLVSALGDENPAVCAAAAVALGKTGERKTAAHLLPLVNDPDTELSQAARDSLGALGVPVDSPAAPLPDLEAIGSCCECDREMPTAFLKVLGSYSNGRQTLCEAHFASHQAKVVATEGRLRVCKQCKANWPRMELVESRCPDCRRALYLDSNRTGTGRFRCYRCLKLVTNRERSLATEDGEPLCNRCAHALAAAVPVAPFHAKHAIDFLRKCAEADLMYCERCRRFRQLEKGVDWSYRDRNLCVACEKK